jgi:hypothetical protein
VTLRSLENKWQTAIKEHNDEAIDKLLADGFEATSVAGKVASKEKILREVREDKNVYHSARVKGVTVKMKRPGVAVVTGTAEQTGLKEDGRRFSSTIEFTDTWRLRDGEWVCIASEATKVSER